MKNDNRNTILILCGLALFFVGANKLIQKYTVGKVVPPTTNS